MQSLNSKSQSIARSDDKDKPVILAVIPAFNEEANIREILGQVSRYVNSIIVIDDGSCDSTFREAALENVKVIRNRRNMGKGAALKRGFIECLACNPDIIITLDADGQHDPAEIPKLLKPIENEEADIVIGSRYDKNSPMEIPIVRRIGLSMINLMNKTLVRSNVTDTQSGFRAYGKSVLNIMLNYDSTGYGLETEQLARAELYGFRIMEVPVSIRYKDLENTSKKNSVLHGANILSTILKIAVERRPLLFFGLAGIILLGFAIITSWDMLLIFNKTRYFSIPLALITVGLALIGSLLILISFVLHALRGIRERCSINY